MPETRWDYLIDVVTRTVNVIDELMYYFYHENENL